ncbi:hypothetical protein [Pseudonocardia sp. ICBG1293]|nr:hypothetical protein [Pseudonocardia sp. ICBG1293]
MSPSIRRPTAGIVSVHSRRIMSMWSPVCGKSSKVSSGAAMRPSRETAT